MKKFLALAAALALSFSVTACSVDNDNNAADTIDRTTYKVGVGSYTTTEDSSSSVEDSSGKGVVSTTYATVIFDENDIIRKIYIDEVESKIYFDSKGHLDENKNNKVVRSKRELGDEYGMKAASNIGKEWYEQINSLEDYLVGKNIREINNFVMNNGDYGTENDYADSLGNENNGENMAGNAINDAVDGAKNIADGIMNGARNILGRNGSSSGGNGTSTAEGITDNTDGSVADGTNDYNSGTDNTDSNMTDNGTDGPSTGTVNWEEDLKSSVTIDLTNIQKAVQKAYENAR
ncbi:MAG: hypothetical protein IKT63_02170 [Oscillospiraceae bacterium]|nr:hypothetical protein [Oscillospiraceae bacterium]